ncbi:MAG: D-alanyl-D-alanine carboxypeptidase [Eubacterium sp.]|jgi:D-alanyl-D-alanine carboxypeptidase (penicillin-binding protein 5/6)|nr:D-alanyl-D-alanine carboxypeptidase [Eubacterium sp.]
MKRCIALLILLLSAFSVPSGALQSETAQVLIESHTGQVLYAENENKQLSVGSVTKTMLLLIAAEKISEGALSSGDAVTVSPYASSIEGSVIWLEPGEIMTAGDLLKSIIISSANDAAVALAEHLSGSEKEFVKLMNEKAAELGLTNTNFTGCVGFDDPDHYSSAHDMAVVTAKLFEYDCFNDCFKTRLSSVRTGTKRETQLINTNKLANSYDGCLGGKTGTTDKAGYCLSVCAERDGMRLIAVTLGARSDNERTENCRILLDTGFKNYEKYKAVINEENLPVLSVPNGVIKKLRLKINSPVNCVIPKGSYDSLTYNYTVPEKLLAPVEKGQKVGEARAMIKDKLIFKSDIVAAEACEKLTFLKSIKINSEAFFKP